MAALQVNVFTLVLIILPYRNGGLGGILGQLDTIVGLGIFGVFWLCTWYATRRAMRGLAWRSPRQARLTEELLIRGALWGGATGALFLGGLLIAMLIVGLTIATPALGIAVVLILWGAARWRRLDFAWIIGIVFTMVSFGIAPTLGGIVGLLFAVLYGIIFEISKRIVPD
jgi:hypothetical protein